MTLLALHNIGLHFDDGDLLFSNINASLAAPITALIGDNGSGKSTLVELLRGNVSATEGSFSLTPSSRFVSQTEASPIKDQNIAEFLGLQPILTALQQVNAGACEQMWFDIIGDNWQLEEDLIGQLQSMGLPSDHQTPLSVLSGGQRSKLRLWHAFNQGADLLILDEPSNHLDSESKIWLRNLIVNYDGHILLVSHDRVLLSAAQAIWALADRSLRVYANSYDTYREQVEKESNALERQILAVDKQQRTLEKQRISNQAKAQKRTQQGIKLRKSNSQPKCFLDAKKESAAASASNRARHHDNRKLALDAKQQHLKDKQTSTQPVKLYLRETSDSKKTAFAINEGVLPHGTRQPISVSVKYNERYHLVGRNGVGKSVLFNVLMQNLLPKSGQFVVNATLFMLDQHYSLLQPQLSILDNIRHYCDQLSESDARTLLAGIGFRGNSVTRQCGVLSGGEKMRLAVCIVSQQASQPFLLLDEPDNHLDIASKDALAAALRQYQGGFVLVSHDEAFVEETAVTSFIHLGA